MRFLEVSERAGRYVASLVETAPPTPGKGELLIRVAASGLNRADLSQIAGRYPPPPGESQILGLEASGTVEGTSDPVCALLAGGGHAEYVAVPQGQLIPAPPRLELVSAAGIPEAFLTAFVSLVVEGGLTPGINVLIHAGASGVGLAAIQMARLLGARAAATTRTPDKLAALAAAGADLAIHNAGQGVGVGVGVVAEVERHWGTNAVHLILDPIGAATLADDLTLLAPGGRIICLATMGGARADIELPLLLKKRARLIGSTVRARSRAEKAALITRFRAEILPAFATGALGVTVDSVLPPARAAEAFERMRHNRNVGKILIDWRPQAR